MIVVLAAVERELEPIVKRLGSPKASFADGVQYWQGEYAGKPIAALLTGVGPVRARAAAETALAQFGPRLAVSIGYSGGLTEDLGPAGLVVGQGAIYAGRRTELRGEDIDLAARVATDLGFDHRVGWLLTVDRPLISPESKAHAHDEWGALAVEMETAEVADVFRSAGVPCVALRAVSDTAGQSLHVGGKCVVSRKGIRSLARLGLHLLRHPLSIPHAIQLHRQGGKCSQCLALMVDGLIRQWVE